ncbi:MAG: AraC family transcriptional regulator [Panacagrimonas sp.]|jgi:AraC-like DNA-binding protein|nr:AraC family transcriptional regulator [Panacagrimonas sp.]MCC2658219.1 AraC family transcriptional regulator [Panacagrimonas sp.]
MPGLLIRSVILDGAADLIRAHGARPAQIARAAGVPRSALTDPDLLVNANNVLRFFELAAEACKLPTWGLTLGIGGRLAAIIGPLWVLLRNARTIGEMCSELADNFDLYSDAAMVGIERTSDGVLLNWSATAGRIDSEVQMAEFALCVFANEIRSHLRPDWMPKAVLFRHARPPGRRAPYRTAFGANVRFNQDRNSLLMDERTWAAPLNQARGSAARALANRVVRLDDERLAGKRIAHSVEAVVRSLMPYAPCTIDEVSRALDLPARTLQFRLQQQGTSFTQVRDIVRADLASKYLRHSELSASRIAEILGYADVTSLSRSYRRWNGISLRQQRARSRRDQ